MPFTDEEFVGVRIGHTHDLDAWGVEETGALTTIEKLKAASALAASRQAAAIAVAHWAYQEPIEIYPLPTTYAALGRSEQRFEALADEWEADTAFTSAIDTMVLHQSYQDIIGMGSLALPFIFRRLHKSPARWFWALRAIVGHDVAEGAQTSEEAANRWYEWGVTSGYAV